MSGILESCYRCWFLAQFYVLPNIFGSLVQGFGEWDHAHAHSCDERWGDGGGSGLDGAAGSTSQLCGQSDNTGVDSGLGEVSICNALGNILALIYDWSGLGTGREISSCITAKVSEAGSTGFGS